MAPKGTPPGRHALSLREIHRLIAPKASLRIVDQDREWVAEHEAGHCVVAAGLGWRVESVEVYERRGGLTRSYPPDDLEPRERRHEEAVVYAAGEAATGRQFSPGVEDDKFHVRDVEARDKRGGAVRWEDAVASATRVLNVPWCKTIHRRLVDALLEHGRLEGAALQAILRSED
jgi:hypothetical protein